MGAFFDGQEPVRVQFDEETHTYRDERGNYLPGVTTILKPVEDFEHVPQDILKAAADFGTNVHKAIELHIAGNLNWKTLDPALVPYVHAADKWLAKYNPAIGGNEVTVYHEQMRYAGRLDLFCKIRRRTRVFDEVLDWKSSASLPVAAGPQTAAYQRALATMSGKPHQHIRRRVVLLKPDGQYRNYEMKSPADWGIFLSCKNIWNFKHRAV